jgi:PAS domain S-box-containing protein
VANGGARDDATFGDERGHEGQGRGRDAAEAPAADATHTTSARRRAAAARDRLVRIFDHAPVFIATLRGPEHVFEHVNPAYYQVVGHREIVGRPVAEAIPEVVAQGFVALLDGVLATGEPFVGTDLPIRLQRTPDGPHEEVFVDFVYAPITEADGTRSGVVAIGSDVTARVVAARARAAAQATADLEARRLAAVLGALPIGVILVEAPDGRVTYVNDALHRIFGHAPPTERLESYSVEWTGWHVLDGRVTERRYASADWPIARALLRGETVLDEVIAALRADGSQVMISVSAAPIRDAAGAIVGATASIADVDAQHRAVTAIEEARAVAEQANRAKSMFLANMSHELRTPLNAIAGHVHLVEMEIHGPLTTAQRDALGRVQRAQHHLLGLINDVLNFAKLQAGSVEFLVRPVAIAEVIADVGAMIGPQVEAKGLRYRVHVPPSCAGLHVLVDRDKLVQVLLNLLSNAVKFTPGVRPDGAAGEVRLELALRAAAPDLAFVRVRDNGVGIPHDRQEVIFDPFVQVRTGYTRDAEGTGLGLAISRDLAREMGGDVRVRSVEGAGATFTVTLRRAPGDRAAGTAAASGADRGHPSVAAE